MRDPETISTALARPKPATTSSPPCTPPTRCTRSERGAAEFPEGEHRLLREQLANNLRATITQRLVRRTGGHGRGRRLEIMIVNDTIRN